MEDERTSLFPRNRNRPTTFVSRINNRRKTELRRFQCCVCAIFLTVVIIAIIITVAYTVNPAPAENVTIDTSTETDATTNLAFDNTTDLTDFLILLNWPINDEGSTTWELNEPTDDQKTSAINVGLRALGDREMFEENMNTPIRNSPSYKHQRAVSTTPEARKLSKRGYVENQATISLAANSSYKKINGRSNIGRGPIINMGSIPYPVACDFNQKYRYSNGTCNNKHNPYNFGVAYIPFRRMLQPDYGDGISTPREAHDGSVLPPAREVSLKIHRPSYATDPNFSVMLAVFGQFMDHDITATALNQGQDGEPIDCCGSQDPKHPECFPVPLYPGDTYYDDFNLTCMNFVRSAPAPTNRFGPREQLNQATAYLDGSVVYGSIDSTIDYLRTGKNGELRMFKTPDNRELLPVSTDPSDGCNQVEQNAKGQYCFESGDTRSNENLHLTSMHVIWARHHNFLARQLLKNNPHWDDETVFQESRRILAAQLQHITFNEFLPTLLGRTYCEKIGITSAKDRSTDTYDPNVDASIANVFAAAAFRFAHTLLPGLFRVAKQKENTTESIELHRMLFNPYSLWEQTGLDTALDSAVITPLAKSDQYFTTEVTKKLFQPFNVTTMKDDVQPEGKNPAPRLFGLDLVSLNIQRGRDHGLPAYPEWRRHCRLSPADTWEQMENAVDASSLQEMKTIFNDPKDIDVYSGALSEPPLPDSIFGPLLTCIISDQFLRIKRGDSHWYERKIGPSQFTKAQYDQIYGTSLASIICRNSDAVSRSPKEVMRNVGPDNAVMNCSDLDTFDFTPWLEENQPDTLIAAKIATSQLNVLAIKNGKQ